MTNRSKNLRKLRFKNIFTPSDWLIFLFMHRNTQISTHHLIEKSKKFNICVNNIEQLTPYSWFLMSSNVHRLLVIPFIFDRNIINNPQTD